MFGGRRQGDEWSHLAWCLLGLEFHDVVLACMTAFASCTLLTRQCQVYVDNLKVPFVSHDGPQTWRTLGALPGQALQEVSVATSLCVSRPLGIAPQQGTSCCQFCHSLCNEIQVWQRAVHNYEVLLWFLSLLGTQLPSPGNHSSKTLRTKLLSQLAWINTRCIGTGFRSSTLIEMRPSVPSFWQDPILNEWRKKNAKTDLCHHFWIKFIFLHLPRTVSSHLHIYCINLFQLYPWPVHFLSIIYKVSWEYMGFVRMLARDTKQGCPESIAVCAESSSSMPGLVFPLGLADSTYSTLWDRFHVPTSFKVTKT